MVAVIVIHANAGYFWMIDKWQSVAWDIKLAIDQLMRFSVPLFVALSGFGLAEKYRTSPFSLSDFLQRRVLKLLPWYLLWATIIFFAWPHSDSYWKTILLGRADYHLYFVPMIFQLYVLFPLLWILVKKLPRITMLLALLWQVLMFVFITQNPDPFWNDQRQYVLFLSWLVYFVLGIFLTTQNFFQRRWMKALALVLLAAGFAWELKDSFGLINSGVNLVVATRFTRTPVLVFAGGFILAVFSFRDILSFLPGRLEKILVAGGEVSFVTYLLHTLVLRYFAETLGWQRVVPYPLFIMTIVLVSFLSAWGCIRLSLLPGRFLRKAS